MITVENAKNIVTGLEKADTKVLMIGFWMMMQMADDFGAAGNYQKEKEMYGVCKLIDLELFKRNDDSFEWAMHPWKHEVL